jgi:hypothetical protein
MHPEELTIVKQLEKATSQDERIWKGMFRFRST